MINVFPDVKTVAIVDVFLVLFNSYIINEPDDGAFGAFANGSWTGLVGDLVRQVIIIDKQYI